MALKGSQTLFYQAPPKLRAFFFSQCNDRETLEQLFDISEVHVGKKGQGAFLIVGDKNSSAIHSEPKIDEPRIFLSILPGDPDEIEEFRVRCVINQLI